jgi:hypothetical protein
MPHRCKHFTLFLLDHGYGNINYSYFRGFVALLFEDNRWAAWRLNRARDQPSFGYGMPQSHRLDDRPFHIDHLRLPL